MKDLCSSLVMNNGVNLSMAIPYPADIFPTRQGIASKHSRGPVRLRFSIFFLGKTRKKMEKLRLPPRPLVRALAGWKNISSANAFFFYE